jgi:hypothetical protein
MKGISLSKLISHPLLPSTLYNLYIDEKKSVNQIAKILNCSQNKINYWLEKFEIPKRTVSEAIYTLKNPKGDPFTFRRPETLDEAELFGLGIGLYWGEGTKRGKSSVRLSNADSKLIRKFIEFLEKFYAIDKNKLKFSLQIFSDISPKKSLNYWIQELQINKNQFYKPQVIKVRGEGTYKYKSKYGVMIIYFNNTKLQKHICQLIENIK